MTSPRTLWILGALLALLGANLAAGFAPAPQPSATLSASSPSAEDPPENETRPPPGNRTNRSLPAPTLGPENQSLTGSTGQTLSFGLTLRNGANEPQTILLHVYAPLTWHARVSPSVVTLGPHDSIELNGSVFAPAGLPSRGLVTIEAQGHDGSAYAYVDVCWNGLLHRCLEDNATRPPREPRDNETKPPRNDTSPPKNETKPPANDTQPGNDTQESSSPAPPMPASAPAAADAPVTAHLDAGGRPERVRAQASFAGVDGEAVVAFL